MTYGQITLLTLLHRIWPVLVFSALVGACAASSPQDYSQKIGEIRDVIGAGAVVDELAAARFFTGIEAYQQGDFETACRELGNLYEDYPIATLQFAALSAEGRCQNAITSDDWRDVVDYRTDQLSVVDLGICGASFSGCSVVPLEYAEAAAWDRVGLLSGDDGFYYYAAVNLWDRGRRTSIEWMRLTANTGNPAGQLALGKTLIRGGVGASDGVDAGFAFFEAAANQGFPAAEYIVAEYYFYGRGPVPRDTSLAAVWYGRAAEHGATRAQYSLGVLYRLGQGVEQDETEALKWSILAARSRNPIALRVRDELNAKLPAERVAVAREAANRWLQDFSAP